LKLQEDKRIGRRSIEECPRPWPYGQDLAAEKRQNPPFHGLAFESGGTFAPPISVFLPLSYFYYKYLHTQRQRDELQQKALV